MINIKQTLKKTVLGAAAVATLGTATFAATAADARPHGGDRAGVAIGAGILGLALGAAIASSHHDYGPAYGYGYGPGYYGYGETCRTVWQWSPRWGRYVQVERCY